MRAMTTGVKVVKVRISDVTNSILRDREKERREKEDWVYRFAKIEYLIIKRFVERGHQVLNHPCYSCPAYNFCATLAGIGAEPTTNASAETTLGCRRKIFDAAILDDIMMEEKEGDHEKWVNVVNEFSKTYKILEERTQSIDGEDDS